jgi:hypothetical protein
MLLLLNWPGNEQSTFLISTSTERTEKKMHHCSGTNRLW